jgi:hypothetical protein
VYKSLLNLGGASGHSLQTTNKKLFCSTNSILAPKKDKYHPDDKSTRKIRQSAQETHLWKGKRRAPACCNKQQTHLFAWGLPKEEKM